LSTFCRSRTCPINVACSASVILSLAEVSDRVAHGWVGEWCQMSSECSGISYTLRLRRGIVEVRPRFLQHTTMTFEIGKIKSVELLRKSVIPPLVVGGIALSFDTVAGIDWGLTWFISSGLRAPMHLLALGTAIVCLVVLTVRWFFASMVVKPIDMSTITVRMIPVASARSFVKLIQTHASAPNDT